MGLFSFIKNSGEKLFGKNAEEVAAEPMAVDEPITTTFFCAERGDCRDVQNNTSNRQKHVLFI